MASLATGTGKLPQLAVVLAGTVSTGSTASVTVIVWLILAELPEQSVAVQVLTTIPSPHALRPEVFVTGIPVAVTVASQTSDAGMVAATGMFPQATVILAGIAAAEITGGVLSITVISCWREVVFPAQSVTVQRRVNIWLQPLLLVVVVGIPVDVTAGSQLSEAGNGAAAGILPQVTVILAGTEPPIVGGLMSSRVMI